MPDGATTLPTLMLYGIVGEDLFGDGFTAKGVADWLTENAGAGEIELRLNSGGGFLDDGLAIYNLIRGFPGKTTVRVDGVAASAASLIAMAGDERVMGEGALLMVHNAWTVTMGNASEHRKSAETLDKQSQQLISIYAARTGRDVEQVKAWADATTWFDAAEALEHGFATRIDGAAEDKALACVALDHLKLPELPRRIAQARLRHPDQIPAPRQKSAAAPPVLSAELKGGGRNGQAAPGAVVEVIKDMPMTAPTSAAQNPADPAPPQPNPTPPPASPNPNPPSPQPAGATNVVALDEQAVTERARAEERSRIAEIHRMCGLPMFASALPKGFVEQLVADGIAIDAARAKIIDAAAAHQQATQPDTRNAVRVDVVADERDKWQEGALNQVFAKAGLAALVEKATGKRPDPGEFRGMSLRDLARDSLERAGVRTRGMDPRRLVGDAFTARTMNLAHQTTSDFSVLMETAINKTLFAAYRTTPDKWTTICATGSVPDFRPFPRYRLGSFGALDTVREAGEFKHKAIPDGEKTTIQISTKGNIVTITRQAIINDDLGFLNGTAVALGRAARLSIEIDVFALIAQNSGLGPTMGDGLTLFHASHNNVGTGGVPSVTTFDEARQKLASQKDISGNEYIEFAPAVWLGPLSQGATVRVLVNAQYDPSVSNKFQVPNAVNGLVSNIVDTARLTGTRWYIFADPNVAPTFEVAFLDGVQEPFIDQMQGWTVDGSEWKVRLDYGVGAIDYRGAVTNAGA